MATLENENLSTSEMESVFKIYGFLDMEKTVYEKNIAKCQDVKTYLAELKMGNEQFHGFFSDEVQKNSVSTLPMKKKESSNIERNQMASTAVNNSKAITKNVLSSVF